ncbi:MAG: DUF5640 domain-containing protein [Bacteroides sp.]|nr:DUF5640 domain-containing protein [Bacteroides sp.]
MMAMLCITFTNCSDDDQDVSIVGKWESITDYECTVTFNSNGTGNIVVVGFENDPEYSGSFTWKIEGDEIITNNDLLFDREDAKCVIQKLTETELELKWMPDEGGSEIMKFIRIQ